MATKRRRQVTYVDDENLARIDALKKLGMLSKFLNWTLRNNIEAFIENIYKEKDDVKLYFDGVRDNRS